MKFSVEFESELGEVRNVTVGAEGISDAEEKVQRRYPKARHLVITAVTEGSIRRPEGRTMKFVPSREDVR